jgi:predicted metal-dependent phosphotriesterase family hydrolase
MNVYTDGLVKEIFTRMVAQGYTDPTIRCGMIGALGNQNEFTNMLSIAKSAAKVLQADMAEVNDTAVL